MNITPIIISLFLAPALAEASDLFAVELAAISFNETSGGLNMNHRVMRHGMHRGDRAGGRFGLMPLTVRDLISKNDVLRKYQPLLGKTNEEISEAVTNDPQMDFDIAITHWKKLRKSMGPRRAAYGWLHGLTAAARASQADIEGHWYPKKFHDTLVRKFIRHAHAQRLH